MSILAWIVIGGIAGWIASMIMNTDAQQGVMMNIVVGVLGAFIGGLVFSFLGFGGLTGFNLYSLLVAIVGAVVLLGIYRAIA